MPRNRLLTLLFTVLITSIAAVSVPATAAYAGNSSKGIRVHNKKYSNDVYIVRMADEPAAAYTGKIRGYAATRPATGEKLDASRPEVEGYRGYLRSRHDDAVAKVGGRKIYSYGLVFNGFAAELNEKQAQKLASMPGVLAVMKDELRAADTSTTPAFLGISAHDGLWDQLDGPRDAGESVVVGIIDSGIWPENASFANDDEQDRDDDHGHAYGNRHIRGWKGSCESGERFVGRKACNGKIIGARYFNAAWGGDAGIDAEKPWEFNSPRDYDGHGTHTAATAAGNYRTKVSGPAAIYGRVSGMAPGAKIASYKVLWADEDGSGAYGFTSDLVAGIDQAVEDGVDVINYSVAGTTTDFRDPVEIAFLYAADAGIFVAASAGNNGDAVGTVAHPSPWITTVAAGTHNRSVIGTVTLGNGSTYTGAGLATVAVAAPLIDSIAAGAAGASATAVSLCFSKVEWRRSHTQSSQGSRQDRGLRSRHQRPRRQEPRGAGSGRCRHDPAEPDVQFAERGLSLGADGASAEHRLCSCACVCGHPGRKGDHQQGDDRHQHPCTVHGFVFVARPADRRCRRPAEAGHQRPGPGHPCRILARRRWSRLQPVERHVDVVAAHRWPRGAVEGPVPEWTPMMIKSALMTTAGDVLDGPNTNPLVIFRQGAGHVAPNEAADPGLVFDSGWNDWLGFLCGTQLPAVNCTSAGIPVLDPSNFNTPSIAIGDLIGVQTVTRTVTNVDRRRSTYNVSVAGMVGVT